MTQSKRHRSDHETPGGTKTTPPGFFKTPPSQNFILTGKRPVQWLVENATPSRIKEKVGTPLHQPPRPPFHQGFSQKVS